MTAPFPEGEMSKKHLTAGPFHICRATHVVNARRCGLEWHGSALSTCSHRRALPEHRHGRATVHRLMKAALVVEGDPFADADARLDAVGVAVYLNVLVFERTPEPFDENVVHPAATTVHGDADASISQWYASDQDPR